MNRCSFHCECADAVAKVLISYITLILAVGADYVVAFVHLVQIRSELGFFFDLLKAIDDGVTVGALFRFRQKSQEALVSVFILPENILVIFQLCEGL